MSLITHVFEPSRLFLIWQAPLSDADAVRSRRIVGELVRSGSDITFRYLPGTEDYHAAVAEGFREFTALPSRSIEHRSGVMESFLRRLPPRKREDFPDYLRQHKLSPDFAGSDFALLGYTGARLPSDSFEICPDLSSAIAPIDFVLEVAGFRHHAMSLYSELREDDEVEFEREASNSYDPNAVIIKHKSRKIGYVSKGLSSVVSRWMEEGRVFGKIARLNGKPDRPLVYIMVNYR